MTFFSVFLNSSCVNFSDCRNYCEHKPCRSNDISSFEKFSVPSDSMLRHSRVANSRMSFSYRALLIELKNYNYIKSTIQNLHEICTTNLSEPIHRKITYSLILLYTNPVILSMTCLIWLAERLSYLTPSVGNGTVSGISRGGNSSDSDPSRSFWAAVVLAESPFEIKWINILIMFNFLTWQIIESQHFTWQQYM